MKKTLFFILSLLTLSTLVMAKPVTKEFSVQQFDIGGDGELENVWVESGYKVTKKCTTISHSYFTENYMEYLGQEVVVNGEVIIDDFIWNN